LFDHEIKDEYTLVHEYNEGKLLSLHTYTRNILYVLFNRKIPGPLTLFTALPPTISVEFNAYLHLTFFLCIYV